jgi:Regulator of chromosome condensation (RCC1) repeat/Immunoglobulin domain/Immunoglobulin I-set domain
MLQKAPKIIVMKRFVLFVGWAIFIAANALGQVTNALPGRSIIKLLPDYVHPRVLALNQADGSVPGTVLALNPTNGAIMNEISVDLNPSDMAVTPAGDALFVINAGSRTISKVDLNTFAVVSEKAISTPSTYSLSNPLYVVAGQSNELYYTDGAWGPEIYSFDYNSAIATLVLNTGGNQSDGAGGMALTRSGNTLYTWAQYGWGAGNVNSWVTRYDASNFGTLTSLEQSFTSWRRDPLNTPVFLDAAERWVFNKEQMFAATNVSVLLNQFSDNIYGISLDGTIAFGPTEVFNTQTAATLTNLPFSTTVQTLSGDQTKLFRYNSAASNVVIYNMASIASVSGTTILPTPANGSVVSPPLTNLTWTVSPVALTYDVYFGTNQAQVAGATQGSTQYLGRVSTPGRNLSQPLSPGATYYWRVDVIGFNSTNTGSVWSFTVSSLFINPSQVNLSAIAGFNPASQSLSITSSLPATTWSAAVTGSNWLTLMPSSGPTPTNATITFNTSMFTAGTYTNNIEFTSGGIKYELPVTMTIYPLNIVKMAADRQRPYIYALQAPPLSGQNGLLLFINTTNGNIDKALTIGLNPVDLSINYFEGRLYIASWGETWTYVVDLNTQTLLPSLNLGTDIYKVNAGAAGKIITEGEDQWIAVNLVNTADGTIAGNFPYPEREGDGECDPSGNFYYHCDNNISDAYLHKFTLANDAPVEIAGSNQHPYGTRNLVMSSDGSRLFWNSYIYDTNLTEYGTLGTEIYSCSTNGSVAFGSSQAFDTATRQAIYNLPASTTVSVVDGKNQHFWYFNSATATLGSVPMSVVESPTITTQPAANTSLTAGGSVYLTVTAMGLAPLSYQWMMSGTNLPGNTNYFLSINNIQSSQQGSYQVSVANAFGSVTSTVAQVTVLVPPSITGQSSGTNVAAGQSLSLFVNAAGSQPFTYRWLFENSTIAGATGPILTITNVQSANEGIYRAVVANSVGTVTGAVISVRITPSAPIIINNPAPLTLPASSNAIFSVTAVGSQPLGYQWYFKSNIIAGANSAQYILSGIQSSNSGSYQVVVSNSLGSVTSAIAMLTVTPLAPYFVLIPIGASVSAGSSNTFLGLANGTEPISYQWQHNSTNLPGATQAMLILSNLGLNDAGNYTLLASNVVGVTPSPVAQLIVYQNPSILQPLTNQVVDVNNTVTLAVSALGSPTLAYSWQLNGLLVTGSNLSLTISNILLSQSGYYCVTVTNQFGSASSTGRVSVFGPQSSVISWGDNSGGQTNVPVNLANVVAVSGGDYHSLALRHDGTLIAWGYNGDGQTSVPTNVLRFVSIASGASHNLAITENGSLAAWGGNDYGQINIPPTATNNILAVAAGDAYSLALLGSGKIVAWGDNSYGQTAVPQALSGVTAIAAGRLDSLALTTNGTVFGWGFNAYGQTTPPTSLSNVIAIAAGYLHSAALSSNGTVVVWGDNTYGQTNVPPGLTNVIAIAAGDFDTLALCRDGTVVGWGDDSYGQISMPATVMNAVAVASGNYHGLALIQIATFLQAQMAASGLIIQWPGAGVLQSASSPNGPFTDVLSQGNCYTNVDMSAPVKFFRIRH